MIRQNVRQKPRAGSSGGDAGPPRVALAGLLIDNLDLSETVDRLEAALKNASREVVLTPNVDHLVRFRRDLPFQRAYNAATMRLADGMPLLWMARVLGRPLKARVTGADLLPALCKMAARRQHSVFLFGGRDDVAVRAAIQLKRRYPGLRISGTHSGENAVREDGSGGADALSAVMRARPDILFVGLGTRRQELWVHRNARRLRCGVIVCCGGAIDVAAGVKRRAPLWVQHAGMEWLWRLLHEPRRLWRRYLVDDLPFISILLREMWRARIRKSPA